MNSLFSVKQYVLLIALVVIAFVTRMRYFSFATKRRWRVACRARLRGAIDAVKELLPIGVVWLCCIAALYVPDQSISLQSSLRALLLFDQSEVSSVGFIASWSDVAIWLLMGFALLTASWCYFSLGLKSRIVAIPNDRRERWSTATFIGLLLLTAAGEYAILAPFGSGVDFLPTSKTFLPALTVGFTTIVLFVVTSSFRWAVEAVGLLILALTSTIVLGLGTPISFALTVVAAAAGYRPRKSGPKVDVVVSVVAAIGAMSFAASADSLRETLQSDPGNRQYFHAIIVSAIWIAPICMSLYLYQFLLRPLLTSGKRSALRKRHAIAIGQRTPDNRPCLTLSLKWSTEVKVGCKGCLANFVPALSTQLALNGAFIVSLIYLGSVAVVARPYAPSLALAIATLVVYALASLRFGWLRRAWVIVAVLALVGLSFSFNGLGSQFDLQTGNLRADVNQSTVKSPDQISFSHYLEKWKAARGNDDGKSPYILVAAAGGGVRAAAHVSLSLAAVDEASGGKLGSRVVAISGVSGGALGALLWVSAVESNLMRTPPDSSKGNDTPWRKGLQRYFTHDFVSPDVAALLGRDVPRMLFTRDPSATARDDALKAAWTQAWIHETSGSGTSDDDNRFSSPFGLTDSKIGDEPIMAFTSTSVADGLPAIRSTVDFDVPDAHKLTLQGDAVSAALDSARFPVVSTVGEACMAGELKGFRFTETKIPCPAGWSNMRVDDGGYADNSGLAVVDQLIDLLKENGVSASRLYVIYISSNPEAGIGVQEGKQFLSGDILSNITAPMATLEATRVARAEAWRRRVEAKVESGHFVQWDLAQPSKAAFEAKGLGRLADGDASDHVRRELAMAPLGWTLDPFSAKTIVDVATGHAQPYRLGACMKSGDDAEKALCAALKTSSPRDASSGRFSPRKCFRTRNSSECYTPQSSS